MKQNSIKKLVLSAMFIALGYILPLFCMQIPTIGQALLPMYIPAVLCGLVCGAYYGCAVGIIIPISRSIILGVPVFYPMAIAVAVDMAFYSFFAGYLYTNARWQCIKSLYRCLIISLVISKLARGIATAILLGFGENGFGLSLFISQAIVSAIPGIVLQLTLVPAIMAALNKTKLLPFKKEKKTQCI